MKVGNINKDKEWMLNNMPDEYINNERDEEDMVPTRVRCPDCDLTIYLDDYPSRLNCPDCDRGMATVKYPDN